MPACPKLINLLHPVQNIVLNWTKTFHAMNRGRLLTGGAYIPSIIWVAFLPLALRKTRPESVIRHYLHTPTP